MKGLFLAAIILVANGLNASELAIHQTYLDLSQQLRDGESQGVPEFIEAQGSSIYSKRLRNKYLYYLAKQSQWNEYLDYYDSDANNSELACYHLLALHKTGESDRAFNLIRQHWLHAYTRPIACQQVFSAWHTEGGLTEMLLWHRFYLALKNHQWPVIKHIKSYMNASQLAQADYWLKAYKNPDLLSADKLPKGEHARWIILTSLTRNLRSNIPRTKRQWQHWSTQYNYTDAENNDFIGKVVLYHAMRGHQATEVWAKRLRPTDVKPVVHEWRVRSALLRGQWDTVRKTILAMPESLRRQTAWQYWLARTYQRSGQTEKANAIYAELSKKREYYGFAAQLRQQKLIIIEEETAPVTEDIDFPFAEQLSTIKNLLDEKKYAQARLLSAYLEAQCSDEQRFVIADYFRQWGWYGQAIRILNSTEFDDVLGVQYPLAFADLVNTHASKHTVAPAFVFAIMRQESRFQHYAKSRVGALGLMQIMPDTGRRVAKSVGKSFRKYDLLKPSFNIALGTAYMQQLMKKFQHPLLAAAAYNAGARVVSKWSQRHRPRDMTIWIETLPYRETRRYLKKVIHNYVVYQHRLGLTPTMKPFLKPIH